MAAGKYFRRDLSLGAQRAYWSWIEMKKRCEKPRHKDYPRYGGVGIRVCDQWSVDFFAFLKDMGERPEGTSIDRIHGDGDYTPNNCRWVTQTVQQRNRSDNVAITFDGRTMCAEGWAEETGVGAFTIIRRLRRGWSTKRALFQPTWQYHRERKVFTEHAAILDAASERR